MTHYVLFISADEPIETLEEAAVDALFQTGLVDTVVVKRAWGQGLYAVQTSQQSYVRMAYGAGNIAFEFGPEVLTLSKTVANREAWEVGGMICHWPLATPFTFKPEEVPAELPQLEVLQPIILGGETDAPEDVG